MNCIYHAVFIVRSFTTRPHITDFSSGFGWSRRTHLSNRLTACLLLVTREDVSNFLHAPYLPKKYFNFSPTFGWLDKFNQTAFFLQIVSDLFDFNHFFRTDVRFPSFVSASFFLCPSRVSCRRERRESIGRPTILCLFAFRRQHHHHHHHRILILVWYEMRWRSKLKEK